MPVMLPLIPIVERMLGWELSAGRVGMVITNLLVVKIFHFHLWLVVGSLHSEK
jgi:hypothetical protein